MQNIDTKTFLPYMDSWYETYEFCSEPYAKLGKLRDNILTNIVEEATQQSFFYLPKLPDLDYSGCGLYTQHGDSKSWTMKSDIKGLGHEKYVYGGYVKSVQNIDKKSCNLNAPETYKLLDSIINLKRAHFARLGNQDIHVHADNPYQEGIRIIINITEGDNTIYNCYGEEFKIKPGEIFWVNTGLPHSLYNYRTVPRINLLIDVEFKENLHNELDAIVSNLNSLNYLI